MLISSENFIKKPLKWIVSAKVKYKISHHTQAAVLIYNLLFLLSTLIL